MNLVPIGRFSDMTRLSVKALRLYAEMELLIPAHVDSKSGYRYYELAQANRAEAIRVLRSVEMPLAEIRVVLDADNPELSKKQLAMHRERLADRLAAHERMLTYLERLMQREDVFMSYDVEITEAAPQRIAATRIHTSLAKIAGDIGGGFGTLMRVLGQAGVAPAGAPLIVYHDVIDDQTEGDIEICVPVVGAIGEDPDVYERELEGGEMASTIHQGPYPEIRAAYHAVTGWIIEHGHEIAGPPRETYLNDPQVVPPEELLTRVEFPIHPNG